MWCQRRGVQDRRRIQHGFEIYTGEHNQNTATAPLLHSSQKWKRSLCQRRWQIPSRTFYTEGSSEQSLGQSLTYTHNSDRPLTCLLPHHTRCQLSSCRPEWSSPARWATLPWCNACLGWRTLGNSPTAWSAESPNPAFCAGGHSEVALGHKTIKRQKVTAFSLNILQLLQVETASMFWYSHRRNGFLAGITLLKMDHTAYNKSSHTDPDQEPSIVFNSARALFSFVRESNRNKHQIDI